MASKTHPQPSRRRSSCWRGRGLAAAPLLALLALGLAGCDGGDRQDAQTAVIAPAAKDERTEGGPIELSEAQIQEAGITVETLKPEKMSDRLVLTANIAANQDRIAHVAPRIEGLVIQVHANLGDRVAAGQTLAVIDSIPMGEAQAEYHRAESELRLAESNYQRADGLFKQKIVSQRVWQEARSTLERAQAGFRAATDRLKMLGGLPDTGKPHFAVVSPFAGVVIEKDVVLGELAKPEKHLFTVADLSTVWIEADVLEKDVGKLALGAAATVTLPAYPGEIFSGKVTYISSMLDRQTRTVKARIEAANPEGKLRIDMFATAVVEGVGGAKVLSLPQEAVLLVQGRPTVYVRTPRGFEARPVETGEPGSGRIAVVSGLAEGEQVVTAGAFALKARQLKTLLGGEP